MKFKERLTEELNMQKISQKNLAKILNISEGNISNWKKGNNMPSLDIFYKLCLILDVSAGYLLGLEDYQGNKIDNSSGLEIRADEIKGFWLKQNK